MCVSPRSKAAAPLELKFRLGKIRGAALLKTSRIPMWTCTMLPYLFCYSGEESLFNFVIGLLYLTFPVNIVYYGVNDFADWDVDSVNPRRADKTKVGTKEWWGYRCDKEEAERLPTVAALFQLPWILWTVAIGGASGSTQWWLDIFLCTCLYNGLFPGIPHLSRLPFVDVFCNVWAYFLPVHWYLTVNPESSFAYLLETRFDLLPLWALHICFSLCVASLHDRKYDESVGKRQIAVSLGKDRTKYLGVMLWVAMGVHIQTAFPGFWLAGLLMYLLGIGVLNGRIRFVQMLPASMLFVWSISVCSVPYSVPIKVLLCMLGFFPLAISVFV